MASVLSHPAVPLALSAAAGRSTVSGRLTLVACLASVLPDVDAVGYWAGVPYDAPLGHRGLTHSLCFAALTALAAAAGARRLGVSRTAAALVTFLAAGSHGLLDAMTTGGMGVAFFSPFSNARYFLPWRVIAVSPIGVGRFLSERGVRILASELTWIWAPCAALAGIGVLARRALGDARVR
jgi:inner membrane protein